MLAVSEIWVPGGVVIFLGSAGMAVAGLRALGLIESLPVSIGAWLALSVASVVGLRGLVKRFFPAESYFQSTDEDVEAYGTVVETIAEVSESSDEGRIRFGGTTWAARSVRGVLPAGTPCRIVHRDNLVWVVEPISEPLLAGSSTDEEK
ncbi:MAG: NfeD family protein [Deltaproteobacteria bacterium]|nr:NfeD family protein [Deltaproteobacteria bacterium]